MNEREKVPFESIIRKYKYTPNTTHITAMLESHAKKGSKKKTKPAATLGGVLMKRISKANPKNFPREGGYSI